MVAVLCCGGGGLGAAWLAGVFADDGPYLTDPDPCSLIDEKVLGGFIFKPEMTHNKESDTAWPSCEVEDIAPVGASGRVKLQLSRYGHNGPSSGEDLAKDSMASRRKDSPLEGIQDVPNIGDEAFIGWIDEDWPDIEVRVGNLIMAIDLSYDSGSRTARHLTGDELWKLAQRIAESAVKRLPPPQ